MPNPPPPLTPNFIPGVGRLATDRYDFEAHILGTNFRHQANQIDVFPTLVLNGNSYTNVQSALEALALAAEPPVIAVATPGRPGIIQLNADLGGIDGYHATVVRLQGYPISPTPPSLNNVLTWNGSAWLPQPAQGVFTANGDLSGSNSIQQVIGLTGTGSAPNRTVAAHTDIVQFASNSASVVNQVAIGGLGAIATNMLIQAQGISSGTSTFSGNLILSGGPIASGEGISGLLGGTFLSLGGSPFTGGLTIFQTANVVNGQAIAAFFPGNLTNITSTDMPVNSGNNVIYIGNTVAGASVPSPTGTIIWSQNGKLNVMQEDGNTFVVGSIPNPSTWGTLGPTQGQTVTYRSYAGSTTGAGSNVFATSPYVMPNSTAVKVDCIFSAKVPGTTTAAMYNLAMGFVVNSSGTVTAIGTVTNTDSRTTGSGTWNAPNISFSGSNLVVTTGYNSGSAANWTVITQITLSPQQ